MAKILVTGGAGFIGANYVFYHLDRKPQDEIVVYDALTYASCLQSLDPLKNKPNFHFVEGNICDYAKVVATMEQYAIDTIVHFAAESHVDRSILGPDLFIETNILGTHTLLKAARHLWIDKDQCKGHFHHISTDEVFGTLSLSDPAFSETTAYKPNSPYSASKASSDHLVRAYVHTYGLKATITNCSNNYGPYQFPEKLIPLAITNLLDGKKVPIYGDGQQIRDWLYVKDHALAIDLILERDLTDKTYNIGGRAEKSNLHILHTICSCIENLFEQNKSYLQEYPLCPLSKGESLQDYLYHVADRPGHDRRYAIDPSCSEQEIGFKPTVSFEQGMIETVKWYLDHESWWRALKDRTLNFAQRG